MTPVLSRENVQLCSWLLPPVTRVSRAGSRDLLIIVRRAVMFSSGVLFPTNVVPV